jgi:membrane protease YdiL (CAAX protease family)
VWGPLLIGLGLAAVFVAGALVVREIPPLLTQVRHVTAYADASLAVLAVTVVNGIAEELFFRGALYAATPRHQVAVTTVAYAIATAATGNVMLAFAAILLGVVVGLERRATGGILAPIITHLTWSVTMLYVLPAILN